MNIAHLHNVYQVELSAREVEYLASMENLSRNLECVEGAISVSLDGEGIRVVTNPNMLIAANRVAIEARRILRREHRRRTISPDGLEGTLGSLPDVVKTAASREGWSPDAVASHLVTFIRSGQIDRYRCRTTDEMAGTVLCGYLHKMFSETPAPSWDMPSELADQDWSSRDLIEVAMDFLDATFEPQPGEDWMDAFVQFAEREHIEEQVSAAAPGL